jgi:hypothetical protein
MGTGGIENLARKSRSTLFDLEFGVARRDAVKRFSMGGVGGLIGAGVGNN